MIPSFIVSLKAALVEKNLQKFLDVILSLENHFENIRTVTQIGSQSQPVSLNENDFDPRILLEKLLDFCQEEMKSIKFIGDEKTFASLSRLMNLCVFAIILQLITKKIFLPPQDTENLLKRLNQFKSLFDTNHHIDLGFEIDCAIAGLDSTSPEAELLPTIVTLSSDFNSLGILPKLIQFVSKCKQTAPKMWYFEVFYLKGIFPYSLHDLDEFNRLKDHIEEYFRQKSDWHIFYASVQILSKIALKSSVPEIKRAAITQLEELSLMKSLSTFRLSNWVKFLKHWSIKNDRCRFALVKNIFFLCENDSIAEDIRSRGEELLNHLEMREKSLGKKTNYSILDLFNTESSSVRLGRLRTLQAKNALILQGEIEEKEEQTAFGSEIDTETETDVGSYSSEATEASVDPDQYQSLYYDAAASLEDALKAPVIHVSLPKVEESNIYLNLLSQFEDLMASLSKVLETYQRQKNSNGLYKFIEGEIKPERINAINSVLRRIKRNYNLKSFLIELVKRSESESILDCLDQPSSYFEGKYFRLSDPENRHSKVGEITSCQKTTNMIDLVVDKSWRLQINLGSDRRICRAMAITRVYYSLDFHLQTYRRKNGHLVTIHNTTPKSPLRSGSYSLYYPHRNRLSHYLINESDQRVWEFTLLSDLLVDVRNDTGFYEVWPLSELERYQIEFDVAEEVSINHESAAQWIKIREKIPDKNQIQRELLSKVALLRRSLLEDLLKPENRPLLHQLICLVVKSNFQPLIQNEILENICNQIGDLSKKLKEMQSLFGQLKTQTDDDESFDLGRCLLEIILTATYATVIQRSNSIDLLETMRLLDLARESSQSLENQRTILFLGGTGAGKSTSVNLYSGVPLKEDKNRYGHTIVMIDTDAAEAEGIDLRHQAIIGQSLGTSQTSVVKGHRVHFEDLNCQILLADFPGSNDTRGEKHDMATALSIDRVIRSCSSVCAIFLVIQCSAFYLDRGNPVIEGCSRLKNLLSTAFSDESIRKKQVRIIITKHSPYENIEERFGDMLTGMITEERDELNRNNAQLDCLLRRNRVEIWEALLKMNLSGLIEFVEVENLIRAENIINEYSKCEGIKKENFKSSFDGPKIQQLFRDTIEQATHTWLTQILRPYVSGIPSTILEREKEIRNLDEIILDVKTEIGKKQSAIFECSQLIENYHLASKTLGDKDQFQLSKNFDNLCTGHSELLANELDDERLKKERILALRESELTKRIGISTELATQENLKTKLRNELVEKSTGYYEEKLLDLNYEGRKELTIRTLKSGAREKAFDEFRNFSESDYTGESAVKIATVEYDGTFVHLSAFHRDYVLVPNNEEERMQLQQNGRTADGRFVAVYEGKNFQLDLGMKADPTGTKIIYSFQTYWGSAQEKIKEKDCYDPESLPRITVKHTIPNEIRNAARVANLRADLSNCEERILTLDSERVKCDENIIRMDGEVQQSQGRILDFEKKISRALLEQKSQLHQMIEDLVSHVSVDEMELEAENLLMKSLMEDKQSMQASIDDLKKTKSLLALVIKSNFTTAQSLHAFANDILEAPVSMFTESLREGCERFIEIFTRTSLEDLLRMCDIDVSGLMDESQNPISLTVNEFDLPRGLELVTLRACFVLAVAEAIRTEPKVLFEFMANYMQIFSSTLRSLFPFDCPNEQVVEAHSEMLRKQQSRGDEVEIYCLMQLLNRPIIIVDESNILNMDWERKRTGDPIFLCRHENLSYSYFTSSPDTQRRISEFMSVLQSHGGRIYRSDDRSMDQSESQRMLKKFSKF